MAENKKSFVLYTDLLHTVEHLSDDVAGRLLKTILLYVNDKNPEIDEILLKIAFEPVKQQLKRDLRRWEVYREKQAKNGKLGGRPKKEKEIQENPENPSLILETQKSLNVNANVSVIPNSNFGSGVVYEMTKIFKKYNPNIIIDPENHFAPCLQIAYRIAKMKGWEEREVLNGKMEETLKSWEKIVLFAKSDDWLSTRSLIDFNNSKEWDRLVMKMSKAIDKSPDKKENNGSPIKKESEVDFEKYKRKA